jgi:hypothetical protein
MELPFAAEGRATFALTTLFWMIFEAEVLEVLGDGFVTVMVRYQIVIVSNGLFGVGWVVEI